MIIGVPKEIKADEYRVAITPAGVRQLTLGGHTVHIEKGAGHGSGISDVEYEADGALMVDSAYDAWQGEIVAKVKEPVEEEYRFLRPDLVLYTYLHLAAAPELTRALTESGVCAIGYETAQDETSGELPMLIPMSEVAGRMAVQAGATYLEKEHGGRGVLLGGAPGVGPGKVAILGAGVVGINSAKIAVGLGARTLALDTSLPRLRYIDDIFHGRVETMYSNSHNVLQAIREADVVIGAVLLPGAKTPWLVTKDDLGEMKQGSVIVDVSVDQGGCVETSRPTNHSDPAFKVGSVTHYCVANMPGAVPRTSTFALTNATFPGLLELAEKGIEKTMKESHLMRTGLNVARGYVAHPQVARSLGLTCKFPKEWMG
ncbi:Alanine dehydrogenase [hydrothermal vent metagenome]|uniref:alanine dehydrogenase n=1 Tax=hydrothermal vent metagenome TaxID=652676 RepID=A0A3B1BPL1_9ZZZZ